MGAHTASYDPKVQMDDLVQLAASAIAQIESITRRWPETMRTLQHLAGITTPGATLPAVGDGGQST